MNHKYGKPKSSRAGCLMCKPHKASRLMAHKLRRRAERVAEIREEEWRKE
jgi:hypothetical protein